MKGSIRMFIGATMIFGGVGCIETSPVPGVAPLLWILSGILLVMFVINEWRS